MKNFNDVISEVDNVLNNAKQGGLEDVLTKTRSYAEKATKKSAERLEISKRKIELLDSKTKLARAYEKYGRLMYKVKAGEDVTEEEIASCEANIELQKMRADMLNAEIEELKSAFAESASKREAKRNDNKSAEPEVEVTVVEPDDE